MDYDIESFMAGLQTGLRLGRAPQSAAPPVPSGEYMITEDEDRMITETGDYMVTE